MFNLFNVSGKGTENIIILAVMAAVGYFLWRYLGQHGQQGAAQGGTGSYQVMGGTSGTIGQLENLALLEGLTGQGIAGSANTGGSSVQSSSGSSVQSSSGSAAGGTASAATSTTATGQGGGGGSV